MPLREKNVDNEARLTPFGHIASGSTIPPADHALRRKVIDTEAVKRCMTNDER